MALKTGTATRRMFIVRRQPPPPPPGGFASLRQSATQYGLGAKEKAVLVAVPVALAARTWAEPRVEQARVWAEPRLELAVDKARTEVLPKVAAATSAGVAAAGPVLDEAVSRGNAALAALRGEVAPPAARRRGRKVLGLGTLAGAAAAAWWAWAGRTGDEDRWSTDASTYRSADAGPSGSVYGGSNTPSSTGAAGTMTTGAAGTMTTGAAGTMTTGAPDASQGDPLAPVVPGSDDAAASPDEALSDASGPDLSVPVDPAEAVVQPSDTDEAGVTSQANLQGHEYGDADDPRHLRP